MKKISFLGVLLSLPWISSAQTDSIVYKASNKEIHSPKDFLGNKKETYSITISVTHIRNHNGVIRFKFFDDTTPFPHKTGFRKVVVPKSLVTGDSLHVTYDGFISQNMGIALLDDENSYWELAI